MGNQGYQSTRKEILSEIVKKTLKSFNKRNLIKTGRGIKDFVMVGGETAFLITSFPYAIPSWMRVQTLKESGPVEKLTPAGACGGMTAFLLGIVADIGQVAGYTYLATHDYPEALLIPVATNVISEAYELGRKAYKNTKENLIEKHNS